MNKSKLKQIVILLLFIMINSVYGYLVTGEENQSGNIVENNKISYEISNIPEYNGQAYVEINNNIPNFTTDDMNLEEDYYSTLKDGKVRNGNGKNILEKSKRR